MSDRRIPVQGDRALSAGDRKLSGITQDTHDSLANTENFLAEQTKNFIQFSTNSNIPEAESDLVNREILQIKQLLVAEGESVDFALMVAIMTTIYGRLTKMLGYEERHQIMELMNKRMKMQFDFAKLYFEESVVPSTLNDLEAAKSNLDLAKQTFKWAKVEYSMKLTAVALSALDGIVNSLAPTDVLNTAGIANAIAGIAGGVGKAIDSVSQSLQQGYSAKTKALDAHGRTIDKILEAYTQRFSQEIQLAENYMDQMLKAGERADSPHEAAIKLISIAVFTN